MIEQEYEYIALNLSTHLVRPKRFRKISARLGW